MGIFMIAIAIAFFASIILFFTVEELSLKDADFSDIKDIFTKELDIKESLEKFDTVKYMIIYIVGVFIIGVIMSTQILIANEYASGYFLAYIFLPSMIGSLIILLVKWRFQPLLKLLSSFMFGAGYIGASACAVGITYLLSM